MSFWVKEKSFYQKMAAIAIPLALQNLINVGVSLLDTVMLGQLGEVAMSGSSLGNQIGFIYQIMNLGLTAGAGVLTSQYWGRKDSASIRKVIEEHFGESAVLEIDPLMPGEDFSALQENCPGFFVELGARSEEKGITFPHHNCRYLMDEDALKYGVEYLYQLVRSRLSIS